MQKPSTGCRRLTSWMMPHYIPATSSPATERIMWTQLRHWKTGGAEAVDGLASTHPRLGFAFYIQSTSSLTLQYVASLILKSYDTIFRKSNKRYWPTVYRKNGFA